MKYCPECGAKLNGMPKFCPKCGTKLSEGGTQGSDDGFFEDSATRIGRSWAASWTGR